MLTACSSEKQHIKLINKVTQAVFTCPNESIIDASDSADIPALDKAIQDTYASFFTDIALDEASSNQLLVKHHFSAQDGGYTTTVSNVTIYSSTSDPVEYRFTALLNFGNGESTNVSGRAQFHEDDKISHFEAKLE